jgi:hypothetical protein
LDLIGTQFSLLSAYRLPQSCTGGQLPAWNGAAWTCADDQNSIYSAGDGLLLTGSQFSVVFGGNGSALSAARSDHSHDHGSLSGLGDDDHAQYFAVNQNETVTGIPAFNGGTSGSSAPFSVDSNTLVSSLNADLLDNLHASDLAPAAHSHDHGSLSGLTDDDHSQYFAVNQNETVTGIPAFNGGTSGSTAPFNVDSDTLVSSLNSDLLDGMHADSFWSLNGNSEIQTGIDFLGTTDNRSLELRVNNQRVMLYRPSGASPMITGGFETNEAIGSGATVAGGGAAGAPNRALCNYCTVSGGYNNTATSSDYSDGYATVSGGDNNIANGESPTVSGGSYNQALSYHSTVGGGAYNVAENTSTISGGAENYASNASAVGGGWQNSAAGWYSVIGGGQSNEAPGSHTFVGGGEDNVANATVNGYSAVVGGNWNQATADYAFIGGGYGNYASNTYTTIGGGGYNAASSSYASVAGGTHNTASGSYASVPGGYYNTASGTGSFAAGHQAQALNNGSFVWSDALSNPIASTADNQFIVQANGGIFFTDGTLYDYSAFINTSVGAYLTWSGYWMTPSDVNLKENFTLINHQEVLQRLAEMPVQSWNYIAEGVSTRHIGPTAQDFYAAFGYGDSDTRISTLDADGVALASIQALNEKVDTLEAENEYLSIQVAALQSASWLAANGFFTPGTLFSLLACLLAGLAYLKTRRTIKVSA